MGSMNTVIASIIRKLVEFDSFFMSPKSVIFSTAQDYFYTDLRRTILKTFMNSTKKFLTMNIFEFITQRQKGANQNGFQKWVTKILKNGAKVQEFYFIYFFTITRRTNQSTEFSWFHWIQWGVLIYQYNQSFASFWQYK